jgi:Predicted flavin-nucleotide-binding protein
MRKASREMDTAFAMEVLDKAPYITVSFTKPDGSPYGVPLSLARKDDKTFYFHGAMEGEKMDCIGKNPKVALSAVTKCTLQLARKTIVLPSSTNPQWR